MTPYETENPRVEQRTIIPGFGDIGNVDGFQFGEVVFHVGKQLVEASIEESYLN